MLLNVNMTIHFCIKRKQRQLKHSISPTKHALFFLINRAKVEIYIKNNNNNHGGKFKPSNPGGVDWKIKYCKMSKIESMS